ncbi:MAG: DUF1569 domain-containing protein [Flavobacteriaceae bacterium]|nr:DUF1569 domain-containing protein [Flavobacteriaceae bacterium]
MNIKDPDFLDKYIVEIESYIDNADVVNTDVSQASIGWHLHHTLLTIDRIYTALESSNPSEFKSRMNAARTLSLTGNFIPRGRAQSPASVRPPEDFTTDDINDLLIKVKELAPKFADFDKKVFFDHPYFGHLNRSHSMRFLQVHSNHHLKIVQDIL